jgi:hypothetical protein
VEGFCDQAIWLRKAHPGPGEPTKVIDAYRQVALREMSQYRQEEAPSSALSPEERFLSKTGRRDVKWRVRLWTTDGRQVFRI